MVKHWERGPSGLREYELELKDNNLYLLICFIDLILRSLTLFCTNCIQSHFLFLFLLIRL